MLGYPLLNCPLKLSAFVPALSLQDKNDVELWS
jgi:hypothetical protein